MIVTWVNERSWWMNVRSDNYYRRDGNTSHLDYRDFWEKASSKVTNINNYPTLICHTFTVSKTYFSWNSNIILLLISLNSLENLIQGLLLLIEWSDFGFYNIWSEAKAIGRVFSHKSCVEAANNAWLQNWLRKKYVYKTRVLMPRTIPGRGKTLIELQVT